MKIAGTNVTLFPRRTMTRPSLLFATIWVDIIVSVPVDRLSDVSVIDHISQYTSTSVTIQTISNILTRVDGNTVCRNQRKQK